MTLILRGTRHIIIINTYAPTATATDKDKHEYNTFGNEVRKSK